MPISDLFMQQIQPGLAAFTGVPAVGAPAAPIPMSAANQAAMQIPGASAVAPDPNLPQGLIPGIVNTGMQGGPAFVPGAPPPMPPPQDVASTAPSAPVPAPTAVPAPQDMRPVMSTVGGSPAHEVMKAGPTQIALQHRADQVEKNSIYDQSEAAQKAAKREATQAVDARDQAQMAIDAGQAAQAQEQARLTEARQKYDQAAAPLDKPIEDYWSDKSVGTKALTALSLVAGAIGAAFSQSGQNVGMQLFQQAVDQDLRTKQMNYQRQVAVKDRAQQDFNNLANQIGLAPAKDKIRAAIEQKAAAQVQLNAANNKIPEAQAGANKAAAELEANALKRDATAFLGYQQATKGQRMIIDPVLGVPVSADKYGDYRMKQALEGQQQEGQLRVAEAKEGRKNVQEGVRHISDKEQAAGIPGTLSAIDAAAQEFKTGNTKGVSRTGSFVKDHLGETAYSAFFGKEASQREQDWGMLKSQVMKSITGAGMSDAERERYDAMLEGAKTPEARIHSIQRAREAVVAQRNAIRAGAGPEAAAEFDRNLKAVSPQAIKSTPAK